MKKLLTLLSTAVGIFAACQQEDIIQPNEIPDSDKVIVNLAIDGAEETDTKSVVTVSESGIADITLFIFQNGKCSEAIYATPANGKLEIISEKGYASDAIIDVYGVLNMGDRRSAVPEGSSPSALADLRYSMSNIADLNSNGFPMSGSVSNAPVGTPFTLHMRRLTAKYGFKINTNLKYGTFTVTSLQFINAARYTYPFVEQCKATSTSDVYASAGDYATAANVNNLNNGIGVVFYALENCQGTLLPSNKDPWQKIPSNISAKKDLCTYIEVKGTYTDNSGGLKATHTYRMYLGQDNITNFDVIRNTEFNYTLTLSDDGFLRANWKAEREVESDSRSLSFARPTYEVNNGEDCAVVVNYSPKKFDCTFELSDNLKSAGVSFDPTYMVLKQSRELDADVTGTLTATSWDGEKTATCNVIAKKYSPGDVVIIIKPSNNTAYLTEPDAVSVAELELVLVNDDNEVIEYYDATDWHVESSNQELCIVEEIKTKANNQTFKLKVRKPGKINLRASCKNNGEVYNSTDNPENEITIIEDRRIEIELPERVTSKEIIPITLRTNFDEEINVTTNISGMKLDGDVANVQGNDAQSSYSPFMEKDVKLQCYGYYPSDNLATFTITAKLPDSEVVATASRTIEAPTNLTLYIHDIWYLTNYLHGEYYEGTWEFGQYDNGGLYSHLGNTNIPTPQITDIHEYYIPDNFISDSPGAGRISSDYQITATESQWKNLLAIIDGEHWQDILTICRSDDYSIYEYSTNPEFLNDIKQMLETKRNVTTNWFGHKNVDITIRLHHTTTVDTTGDINDIEYGVFYDIRSPWNYFVIPHDIELILDWSKPYDKSYNQDEPCFIDEGGYYGLLKPEYFSYQVGQLAHTYADKSRIQAIGTITGLNDTSKTFTEDDVTYTYSLLFEGTHIADFNESCVFELGLDQTEVVQSSDYDEYYATQKYNWVDNQFNIGQYWQVSYLEYCNFIIDLEWSTSTYNYRMSAQPYPTAYWYDEYFTVLKKYAPMATINGYYPDKAEFVELEGAPYDYAISNDGKTIAVQNSDENNRHDIYYMKMSKMSDL